MDHKIKYRLMMAGLIILGLLAVGVTIYCMWIAYDLYRYILENGTIMEIKIVQLLSILILLTSNSGKRSD